jgi:hypothetical protein
MGTYFTWIPLIYYPYEIRIVEGKYGFEVIVQPIFTQPTMSDLNIIFKTRRGVRERDEDRTYNVYGNIKITKKPKKSGSAFDTQKQWVMAGVDYKIRQNKMHNTRQYGNE